jgi:hypothetical protein
MFTIVIDDRDSKLYFFIRSTWLCVSSEKKSTAIKLYFCRHEPTATVPWAWLVYEYDVYVAGNYSSSSLGIQYSFNSRKANP